MKKLLFLLISLIILQQASAQSFQKGSLVVGFNYGIDGYLIKEHDVNKATNKSIDTTGGAAGTNLNLCVEYGLFKWLGVGLQFKLDNYFHDSTTTSDVGFEIGATVNAHIIRAQHFDLVAGVDLGFSNLTLNYADNGVVSNFQVYGSGSWFDFHLTPRFYFGRFGLNLNLYLPEINYPNLTTNLSSVNESLAASWKGTGFGATIGLQYRILN